MKPCPHCGSEKEGFIVRGQLAGPAESYFDKDGLYSELNTDKMYWLSLSKTIRCANCLKIRHDVYLYDRATIKEVE